MTVEHDNALAARMNDEMRRYVLLRREAEEAERFAKDKKRESDEQRDRLWEFMEAAGLKTANHELGMITRIAQQKALINDKEALTAYLDDRGMYEAFTRTEFRQQQLNEFAKELIEEGEELPEGMDILTVRQLRFTPRKGV